MIPRTLKNQILIYLIPAIVMIFFVFGFIMYYASYHNILDHSKFDLIKLATKYENKVGSINLRDSLTVDYLKKLQKVYSNGPFELVAVQCMEDDARLFFTDDNISILDFKKFPKKSYTFLEYHEKDNQTHFLYLSYPIQHHWFIWRESLSFIDHGIKEFQTVLLIIVPIGCLLILLILNWVLSNRTKEFTQIIKTVQSISSGSLQRRLPVIHKHTDIGELKLAINQMMDRLEEGFENINSFSSNIAHELRTPLTIIGGEVELALKNAHTENETQLFKNILEEVHYLTKVIKQMLLLSKLERGLIVPEQYEINLTEIVQHTVERFRCMSEQKNIDVEIQTSCKRTVFGDPTLVEEVYNIVLHNAIKYSQPNSKIELKLLCEMDSCHTYISDSCGGLSAQECHLIFNPSGKVKPRDSRDGTGIGLTIAMKIMTLHKGEIFVEPNHSKGCTFHIKFPLAIYE